MVDTVKMRSSDVAMNHHPWSSMIFTLKPPFRGDFQLPLFDYQRVYFKKTKLEGPSHDLAYKRSVLGLCK